MTLVFDEILTGTDVDFKRLGCVNVVTYALAPGTYAVESIEPYTLRYLKLLCLDGPCRVRQVRLREYAHPATAQAQFACSDERLQRLFAAGVLTFRQNSLDVFMDCPSRERAGGCATASSPRASACDLTGEPLVERNFFENFLLPARFEHLPEGMLPMCYPADHNDGVFIPNWALWFVVQLEEYATRDGERTIVDALRPRVVKLMDFFRKYENTDGLLEKLPSWVFVEWSKANDFVQDVNYPSNMLYAGRLAAAEPAVRPAGTGRQGRPDPRDHPPAVIRWPVLRGQRGPAERPTRSDQEPQRGLPVFCVLLRRGHARDPSGPVAESGGEVRSGSRQTKAFSEVHLANSFIGNMLRMELLSRDGRSQQILDESIAYLLYMAERTGTLWENVGAYASCNHGFASHIVHTLYRDVLGVYEIHPHQKRIQLRFGDLKLDWCEGRLPTPHGEIRLRWWKEGERVLYKLVVPSGYQVQVENRTGKKLESVAN